MTGNWHIMLAADDGWEPVLRILLPIVFVILAVLGSIIGKIKEKQARQQGEQQEKEYEEQYRSEQQQARPRQGQQQARRPTPAEQAVAALRSVLGGEDEEVEAKPEPPPARAAVRPGPARAARRPRRRLRPGEESRLGEGVRSEADQMARGLAADEVARRKRIGRLERLEPSIREAETGAVGEARRRLMVNLERPKDALSAIVYSEILGLPKALRRTPDPWDR